MMVIPVIEILRIGKGVLHVSCRSACKPSLKSHNIVWILHRQRFERQGVKRRKKRRVHADSQRECQDRHGCESGALRQHSQAVAHIGPNRFQPEPAALFTAFFFVFLVTAEFDARPALGFRTGQAGPLQIVRTILHVAPQLLFRVVFYARTMQQRVDRRPKQGQQAHTSSGRVLRAVAIAAARRFQPSASCCRRFRPAEVSS